MMGTVTPLEMSQVSILTLQVRACQQIFFLVVV